MHEHRSVRCLVTTQQGTLVLEIVAPQDVARDLLGEAFYAYTVASDGPPEPLVIRVEYVPMATNGRTDEQEAG